MSLPSKPNTSDEAVTKASGITASSPESSYRGEKKKKLSIIPKIFNTKKNSRENSEEDIVKPEGDDLKELEKKIEARRKDFVEASSSVRKLGISERRSTSGIESLNLSTFDHSMLPATIIQDLRVFVATWNVGGKTPDHDLNLEDFLQVEGSADVYVLGFQEIVPLNPGNVLVIEDSEPASKWLALISNALNKAHHESLIPNNLGTSSNDQSKTNMFNKQSLKAFSKGIRAEGELLKSCNCSNDPAFPNRRKGRKLGSATFDITDHGIEQLLSIAEMSRPKKEKYKLVASKQMVGIFLTIWARRELVKDIGHVRISAIGRGIMGYLGNKGCITISMTLHQTNFCFVCSHLASGEKEGDEIKRNSDVAEILKGIHFPIICKHPTRRMPERIIDHDRIIWLGDLNYRVGLSYEETRHLLEDNDWDSLLEKDQLITEREAGRVFTGWNEGRILFAPTYKYSHNSDSYAGETTKSKKKRRTPAWCDRILWRGNGMDQLSYIRGESRFSDHRPVCAVFAVEVETLKSRNNMKLRKGYSCTGTKMEFEECMPQRHSFCDF